MQAPGEIEAFGQQAQVAAGGGVLLELQALQAQAVAAQLEALPVEADDALFLLHALPLQPAVAGHRQHGEQQAECRP
ncbi:hypothetical protein D3C78_956270 [compost metagenome]